MKWKIPADIKIYEALGTVADGRLELGEDGKSAKVYSSSRGKFYTVTYDPEQKAIMSNDNGSYWQGYLGYPAIAFLMVTGEIAFDRKYAEALKGIAWKDINTKFKNDFDRTVEYIHSTLGDKNVSLDGFLGEVASIRRQIEDLDLSLLGKRKRPLVGY